MKLKMRKVITIICVVALLLSSFPTSVFAEEAGMQNELREAIEGGEEMKAMFPNGIFTFVGTRFNVSEDKGTYEIQIARQGGTQGEVTVDFKAIDVSSKYGIDYVIEVPGFLWNEEIPANPDSKPLIEDVIQEETEIVNSDDLGLTVELPTSGQKDELESVLEESTAENDQLAEEEQQQDSQPQETAEEPQQQEEQPEQTAEGPQNEEGQPEQTVDEEEELNKSQVVTEAAQEMTSRVGGLRSAAEILTGKTYNNPDWKELDMRPSEVEALKDNYQDYFDNTPGMETTLTFKDGEYLKSIFIKTIDDDLSESEEQFIIVLSNATGGAEIGEFYTGWVNIIDNEEFEESAFEMEMDKLTVEAGVPQVSVKVRRTKGIHTMTYVTVGTAGSTAEPDVDYIPTAKKLLFLPEVTEQTFTVDLLTTYTEVDKTFAIVIDDGRAVPGSEKTIVTLTKAPGSYPLYESTAETESADMGLLATSTKLTFDYSVKSQSTALEKITPNGKMTKEGTYTIMPDDFTVRSSVNAPKPSNNGTYGITLNPYYANSSANINAPVSLAGVKTLGFTWSNTGAGRSWVEHHDGWLFVKFCTIWCKTKTSYEFDSKFQINGPATNWSYNGDTVKQIHGKFTEQNVNMGIKPWMWNSSSIEYWVWNGKENTDNKLNAGSMRLDLQPYNLIIDNDPADTGVMARTVTGIDASGEPVGTGTPVNVGTMKIRSVSRDGNYNTGISNPTQKTVYRSDVITFEPVFNTDPSTKKSYADDVYFWGYKIRDRQGNWKYFEGNVLNLNSQWFRENAAADEKKGLFANALLRDYGKSDFSIEVRPVFKTKNETFIKLDIDSSKGSIDGFLNGTNSRVFAISRFDTLKLKVITKGNATVHNWYVLNDNSNIKVNSLADATTYFNNVNVGSSGNLPTTSSFIANTNKVELDGSNVNPSVKTELTYKPAARFTNIMPSFNVNAITVQENPASRTKYEAYDIKIISEGKDIRPNFLNDNEDKEFYKKEQADKKAYTFQYKIRSTSNKAVPPTVNFNLYKDTMDVKAQLVESKTLTRDSSGVYSFTLNYWDNRYFGCYATMTIDGVEQAVDFMLQSGAFVTLNDERNNTITAGDAFNPIVYDQVTRNDVYTINGYTQSNFNIEWMNATGDLDKDGVISPLEDSLFKDYRMIDRRKTVGDTYYLKASYDMPTVYYNFVKTDPNRDKRVISGNISLADKTYFNQNAVTTTPLEGIEITVGGVQGITDEKGNFSIESNKFEAGKSYSCIYTYQGYKYTGVMMVGQNNIIIDLFKDPDMELTNLKLFEIPENGGDELKPVNGYISLYDDLDRIYDFEFDLSSARLVGTTITEAIIVIRDKDGGLVSDNFRIAKEPGTPGRFVTRINPSSMPDTVTKKEPTNMSIGDRIYIRPIDDKGMAYPEIAAGIKLVQNPEKIKIQFGVNNEDSAPIDAVPLFGKMMGKLDFLDTTADQAKPITDQDRANLSSLTGSSGKAMKSAASGKEEFERKKIDETEKNLFAISIGFDSDMKEGWKKAKEKSSKSKVHGEAPDFSFSVGIVLVFELADDGNVYFNQLAISGEGQFGGSATLLYVTPIGIPVYVTFSFSLGAEISVALVPKDEDNPPLLDAGSSWKGMVTGEVGIAFTVGVGVELGAGWSVLKLYLTGSAEVEFAFTFVDLSANVSVSFSAALGLRIFIFTKEWTIISKTWGISKTKSMLAARSQLYEPLSGFEQLTRDYLNNRREFSSESPGLLRSLMSNSNSSGSVSECAVIEGAFPYPSNKLVNLPNGDILWVYVDDVPGREDINRTGVYYRIIYADGTWSEAKLIDNDRTLDESPDVLDLGNGEVLITWSDASREFTAADKEIDVLTNMDISAAFFDTETYTMSAPTEITRTSYRKETVVEDGKTKTYTLGDNCGDTSPRAAYDSETGKIILYYVKSDYLDGYNTGEEGYIEEGSMDDPDSISPEEQKLVVGDVVNAFSLITYRFAQKDENGNWVWNDGNSYTDYEEAAMSFMIENQRGVTLPLNYTVDDYKRDWYGQRFLDVSQKVDIKEIHTTEGNSGTDLTDDNGNIYSAPENIRVEQSAELRRTPLDPRIVDTAVISYNGLALFAYSTDEDLNLKTDKDQEIYLQIYNFSEDSFSHPIRLTTDNVIIDGKVSEENCVKDSQPRFVRTNGITYLFWNRNGSIAYMDISGLVKYGLKKIDLGYGTEVYVIDKNNDNYKNLEYELETFKDKTAGVEASTGKWGDIMLAVDKDINPDPSEDNEATADRAITSYDVVTSDDGDVYLVWTEYQTVLKDKEDVSKAADPENQEREKQMFVVRLQPQTMIERVQLDYINGLGEDEFIENNVKYQYDYTKYGPGHYPDKIIVDGKAYEIDYTSIPDVNGFIGGAKAGDPIIKQTYVPTGKPGWSKPIQITTEQGANYDELGVAALEGNTGIKIAFIKYIQTLETLNDKGGTDNKVFRQDLENRRLGLLTFRPVSGVEFTDNSITFGNEKPETGEKVTVSALVKNTVVDAIHDVKVEFYQIVDGEETLIDSKFHGTYIVDSGSESGEGESASELMMFDLVGGDEFNGQILYEAPENNGNVIIKAVLKYKDSDGLEQIITAQKSFTFEAVPEISDLRYEFIGIGKIVLDGTKTNAGNKDDTLNVEISLVDRYGTENAVAYVPVTLKQGESSYFSRELEIPGEYFTEMVAEAGQPTEEIKEAAIIKVGMETVKDEIAVVRSAPSRARELMDEVTGFSVSKKNMSIRKGTTGKVEYNITYKEAPEGVEGEKAALRDEMVVEYISSNPRVVQMASDGTLFTISEGTATVQAILMPATTLSVATKGSVAGGKVAPLAQQLASSATLPSSVLRIENVDVTVYSGTSPVAGGGVPIGDTGDDGTAVNITLPNQDNPDSPTQVEIKVAATVDSDNNAIVNITGQMVADAFKKAQAEAEKNGYGQNGITLVLSVETGNEETGKITVSLPKEVQEAIIANNIASTIIVVDNPDIQISMGLETIKEINRQANSDVNVTAMQEDSSRLTEEARNAVGDRPVYNIGVSYGNGSQVTNFGNGNILVTIPYALGENEKAENICAVYIDENGNVHWLTGSVYDSSDQVLRFRTNHFSLYGVGYNEAASAFTDIEGHWAKNDIEFVASRGLFNGTSKTTFSPNTAMTRGMFVTVLGRLAGADVSGYKESSFTDVKNNAYYMGYIEWARENGIVNGIGNDKFAPDEPVTREQMAVIMQRYAKAIGFTFPKVHEEKVFADGEKISSYAREAVKQMQTAGLINGKGGNIYDPQNTATRAEVSAILHRFVELMISSDAK